MELQTIAIKRPSVRVLGKMRRGHKVRISKGEGVNLLVHPERYNHITRTFQKNKGITIQLSPDELAGNAKMGGEGIFGHYGDKALRWVGNKLGVGGDNFKDVAYRFGDYLKPKAKELVSRGGEHVKGLLNARRPQYQA